ncbi:glutamate synthase-like protein [Gaiella occulta]|uniref:Glutamate synthase-like protein n=1 Tax=Gaiella occulta TaxID=1002870 RepID=A0A7M2YZV8_9ACTN|nr:glutamate synthase large subunit [Gaiella occulta]RDI75637.1 glutamate synthase-like protein [Gaiella occulta]
MSGTRHLLHDPSRERDACGIGLVADARGRASRELLDRCLAGLAAVSHRGAWAADGVSGDGAGVLLPLSAALTGEPGAGLAMCFLREPWLKNVVEEACRAEGLEPAGWRDVPHDVAALGSTATASMPRIAQMLLAPTPHADAEARATRARRRAETIAGVYVASLSFRTVTYKGLCAATQLATFYPDLADPAYAVSWAIFHQRFSTNTEPSWERAQPFRLLCHNGEINTIDGNVAWMEARERALGVEEGLAPSLDVNGSDSALLDNALELLVRSGRDVCEAVTLLVPPAWQNDPRLEPEVRDMHRYGAMLVEPWDGPAGIVFSDGHTCGAALDRNGLRPLRVSVTGDGLVTCSSESGAIPLPEGAAVRRGRLGPGQVLSVDPDRGLRFDGELKRELAARRPYGAWVDQSIVRRPAGEPGPVPEADLGPRHALFGYTREEMSLMLRPIAQTGHDPVYSMGDDAPIAPLAGRPRPLASFFRQRFAQVTNPAIDHYRERTVMSVATLLGPRAGLDADGPLPTLVVLPGFLLTRDGLEGLAPERVEITFAAGEGLGPAVERVADDAVAAVERGATLICLSDVSAGGERAAIPSLLAVAAVHGRLVESGLRTRCSLLVESDEPRDTHMVATLLGYGADAICPRLALETVAQLAASDKVGGDRPSPDEAQRRLLAALEDGVLKVMAKMGISDVASYRGARLFEAVGLDRRLARRFFGGTHSAIGGIGLDRLEREALDRLAASKAEKIELENPGFYKFRKGGEPHATDPAVVAALQEAVSEEGVKAAHALRGAVRSGNAGLYERFAVMVNERTPIEPRDLLELVPSAAPVPVEEVEPVEEIVKRFSGGAMSHGALSAEAHETLAIALNNLGARSNCGEGGEDPARYRSERNSKIKQIASARFGVTAEYAVFAEELQIKVSQGSKPGEGGQIPAHKVTEEIARLRNTQPGVSLISPPPHHDIYSIEDLAQLIFDLREVNPDAAVSVKLVSVSGVGVVAAGVAKAHADVIHVAGADGGTGASPLPSIKHAGAPWELGLAEAQQALVANNLRGRVRLRVDGGFKTGRDVVVAALLGADEYSFGTALLLAEGCLMVRSCHLDTCPVGIASQRPELRAKFGGTPEMVEAYLLFVAQEVRELIASLGFRRLDEAIGRVECLRQRRTGDPSADALDLAPLLGRAGDGHARYVGLPVPHEGDRLGTLLLAAGRGAVEEPRLVEPGYAITNGDRSVGARLAGAIAREVGAGPPQGRVRARFEGSAGQSFGAFLTAGVELDLVGEANDYVGKSMSGGRIVIAPPAGDAGDPVLLGNTVLYGATGGELYCAGAAGERFAVRNSGATAVVEGVGDHACEYMTRGTVVVLGPHGRNLGAGMTGGETFLLDADARLLNDELVTLLELDRDDEARLLRLLERHRRTTGSARAAALLDDPAALRRFRRVVPRALLARLDEEEGGRLSA